MVVTTTNRNRRRRKEQHNSPHHHHWHQYQYQYWHQTLQLLQWKLIMRFLCQQNHSTRKVQQWYPPQENLVVFVTFHTKMANYSGLNVGGAGPGGKCIPTALVSIEKKQRPFIGTVHYVNHPQQLPMVMMLLMMSVMVTHRWKRRDEQHTIPYFPEQQ